MTEDEWLKCDEAPRMLQFLHLGSRISGRKLRLLGCACARFVWHRAGGETPPSAIEAAEAFADGSGTKARLRRARQDARSAKESPKRTGSSCPIWGAYWLAEVVATENAFWAVIAEIDRLSPSIFFLAVPEWARVCQLVRDIAGNPFRPIAIPTACRTPTVVSLATAAYEERVLPSGELDRDRLAVLSDALEEAGCDDATVLTHLRGPGPHVRGCWALDAILGKA